MARRGGGGQRPAGRPPVLAQNPAAQKLTEPQEEPAQHRPRSSTRTATSPPTTTSTSSASTRAIRPRYAGVAQAAPVDGQGRRAVRQARHLQHRGHPEVVPARGARSTGCAASRRGRWSSRGSASRSADFVKRIEPTAQGEVRRVHDAGRLPADAGPDRAGAAVAVPRGPAPGRGDASAGASSPSGSTAKCCRTRTARRSAWSCRGSTASRASSRSSA